LLLYFLFFFWGCLFALTLLAKYDLSFVRLVWRRSHHPKWLANLQEIFQLLSFYEHPFTTPDSGLASGCNAHVSHTFLLTHLFFFFFPTPVFCPPKPHLHHTTPKGRDPPSRCPFCLHLSPHFLPFPAIPFPRT